MVCIYSRMGHLTERFLSIPSFNLNIMYIEAMGSAYSVYAVDNDFFESSSIPELQSTSSSSMRRKTICTIPSSKSPRDNPYTEDDVAVADDCSIKKSFRRLSALYESKRRRRRRKGSACCIPTSADHHTRCFHCNSIIVATSTPITTTTTTAAEDAHSFEELVAQSTRRRSMREQQEEISRQIKLEADRKAEQERIQLQLSLQRKHDELMAQREERRRKRRMIEEELMREQEESKLVYQGASPTANEEKRLAALHRMNILDTPFDENFDRLTSTDSCGVPSIR
eukprot:GEZU01025881.1.p1 GENE.GEZU01025881.1~~GEZU01025881.1.p1  ORF type:complete len:283 (+),score=49.73 GEZU01025881.1:241-1089(+)